MKILTYLKQYEGDGKLPRRVDNLFDGVNSSESYEILDDLETQGFIKLYRAYDVEDLEDATFDAGSNCYYPKIETSYNRSSVQYYAKLTLQGSKYLKEEILMKKEGYYNITVGDGAIANLIVSSPNSNISSGLATEKLATILTQLKGENDLSFEVKKQAIEIFEKAAKEMTVNNTVTRTTYQEILGIGANIVTVAPAVFEFLKLLA